MGDFGEDLINLLHPDERPGFLIIDPDIFMNRPNQFFNAGEGSSSNPFPRQFSKPAFDHVQPRRTRRREVKMKTRVLGQPVFDDRVGVGPIVIQDQMKISPRRSRPIDRLQELQKLLMAMTWITGPDNRSIQHVQGGEQARRSVPLIIVGHRAAAALFHGQARLRSIKGLYLRLFVNAQDKGFIRGIQIEPDDIGQLFNELFVLGKLECFDAMGLQSVGFPDAGHRGMADSNRLGHRPRTPMGGPGRMSLQSPINDRFHGRIIGPTKTPAMGGIFADPGRAQLFKTSPPQNDRRTGDPELFGDSVIGSTVRGRQADSRSQDDSLRTGFRVNPGFQGSSLIRGHRQNRGWLPHEEMITQASFHCKYITETLH